MGSDPVAGSNWPSLLDSVRAGSGLLGYGTMTVTMNEDVGATFQKGLSEWWSEETEYVFQRIERWAAFARGYNRLRSQRLSRGRLTMQEEQEPRWSISSNKLIIDHSSWSPRFHTLKRCRRKSRAEETRINCCGAGLNYQSNSSLDSSCLETYRYDHSIYFKTIGDLRNGKKEFAKKSCGDEEEPEEEEEHQGDDQEEEEEEGPEREERIEWDAASISDFFSNLEQQDKSNSPDSFDDNFDNSNPSTWPIVDLSKLDLNNETSNVPKKERDHENNVTILLEEEPNDNYSSEQAGPTNDSNLEYGMKKFLSFRKTRRLTRPVKQHPVIGENNVVWPGVLLNYTKNIDPSSSPHHHYHQHQRRSRNF